MHRRLIGALGFILGMLLPCVALAQNCVSQLEVEGMRFGIVDDAEGIALYRLDEEGGPEDFLLPDIWEAVPYKDRKILALQIAADTAGCVRGADGAGKAAVSLHPGCGIVCGRADRLAAHDGAGYMECETALLAGDVGGYAIPQHCGRMAGFTGGVAKR